MNEHEKENLKSKLEKRFDSQDKDFKNLLKQLCDEIDKLDTDILHTVCFLKHIPYELAMLIILNLYGFQDDYIGLLNTFLYDEFVADVKRKSENGDNAFVNRLKIQKNQNYEDFVVERLLTLGEIENLINIFIEQEKINLSLEDILNGKRKVKSQNIKKLVEAHKILSIKENASINENIIDKMSKFWLDLTLSEIIRIKQEGKEV